MNSFSESFSGYDTSHFSAKNSRVNNFKYKHAEKDHNPIFKPTDSIEIKECPDRARGKKLFPEPRSLEETFVPVLRIINQPKRIEKEERGKKYIPHITGESAEAKPSSIKRFDNIKESEENTIDKLLGSKKKVLNEEGVSWSRRPAVEFVMEDHFNRKQRINTIKKMRNNIGMSKL